jgi:5-methyltetrahydropteroyltriglutamate--homocysteine methyltransferase
VSVKRRSIPIIPTEPIGSIPRPLAPIAAVAEENPDDPTLEPRYEDAIHDTIALFEATGSPVTTDGHADAYLDDALRYAQRPVKQPVISPSAMSLMHPDEGIPGYGRDQKPEQRVFIGVVAPIDPTAAEAMGSF